MVSSSIGGQKPGVADDHLNVPLSSCYELHLIRNAYDDNDEYVGYGEYDGDNEMVHTAYDTKTLEVGRGSESGKQL